MTSITRAGDIRRWAKSRPYASKLTRKKRRKTLSTKVGQVQAALHLFIVFSVAIVTGSGHDEDNKVSDG